MIFRQLLDLEDQAARMAFWLSSAGEVAAGSALEHLSRLGLRSLHNVRAGVAERHVTRSGIHDDAAVRGSVAT